MQRVLFNFLLAVEGVNANKLRSFLTALGIIFGVGAVIAMLAIGSGAKQLVPVLIFKKKKNAQGSRGKK